MIAEILLVLLIILVVVIILITLKQIHVYIRFKNDNRNYDGVIQIDYLILNIIVDIKEQLLKINFKYFNRTRLLKTFNLANEDKSEPDDNKDQKEKLEDTDKEKSSHNKRELDDFQKELSKYYNLLIEAKPDILDLIKQVMKVCKFTDSNLNLNLGLGDNNSTIKLCNYIWIASALLYPCNLRIFLTPEINNITLRSDGNINFSVSIIRSLRIVFLILTRKNLRNLFRQLYSAV